MEPPPATAEVAGSAAPRLPPQPASQGTESAPSAMTPANLQEEEDEEDQRQQAVVRKKMAELHIDDAFGPSPDDGGDGVGVGVGGGGGSGSGSRGGGGDGTGNSSGSGGGPAGGDDEVSHADIAPALLSVDTEAASGVGAPPAAAAEGGGGGGGSGAAAAEGDAGPAEADAASGEGGGDEAEWAEPVMEELSSSEEDDDDKPRAGPDPIAIPWKFRSNQVFVLTNAGKSVYSRFGNENEMLGYMGVIQAIISRCECDTEERIRHIVAGERSFVFLLKEPLYLLIISTNEVPIQFLRRQLEYVHQQLTFVLTTKVYDHLTTHAKYDVRSMLGPQDEKLLECLLSSFESGPRTLFNAFAYLPLDEATRAKTTFTIQRAHVEHLLYGILLAGDQVVTYCQLKPPKHRLRITDLLLLQNFARFAASSNSLNASVSWMPVCLPGFNDAGFLQALVCFLAPEVCLIFVTTDRSEKQFHILSGARDWIQGELTTSGCLAAIQQQQGRRSSSGRSRSMSRRVSRARLVSSGSQGSHSSRGSHGSAQGGSGSGSGQGPLATATKLAHAVPPPGPSLRPLRVPGLIHFVYRSLAVPQCYFSPFKKPFDGIASRQRIWESYQNLLHDFYYPADPCAPGAVSPHWQMAKSSSAFVAFAFRGSNFELYAHFDPLVSVGSGAQHCNRIITWISQHTKNIFVPSPAVWPIKA